MAEWVAIATRSDCDCSGYHARFQNRLVPLSSKHDDSKPKSPLIPSS